MTFEIATEEDMDRAHRVRFSFEAILKGSGACVGWPMPWMTKDEMKAKAAEIEGFVELVTAIIRGESDGDTLNDHSLVTFGQWRIAGTEIAAFRCYVEGYEKIVQPPEPM